MFGRKKHLVNTPDKNLFLLLEANAERYHGDQTFWSELHVVCRELTAGCISVEQFSNKPATDILTGKSTSKAFHPDEKTIVIKLQNKDTALHAVQLLSELFKSTGTHFIAEIPEGSNTPQIRSNIDKNQAGKLSVISKFYFDREITDPDERRQIHEDSQKIIDAYTKGTDAEGWWKSREGVLPFVSLMGLHGNLRPKERHKPSRYRKEQEFNTPHPHGDPRLFKEVVVHVEMNNDGSIYGVLYDPVRDAYTQAQGGVDFKHFIFELLGGDLQSEKTSIAVKALRTTGLILGTKALLEGDPNVLIIGGVAGLCFGVDLIRKRRNIGHKLAKLQEQLEKQHAREKTIETKVDAPAPELPSTKKAEEVPDYIHEAYTHGHYNESALPAESEGNVTQYLKRIIENGGKGEEETHLKALVASHEGGRRRS